MKLQHRPTFAMDLPLVPAAVAEQLRAALAVDAVEFRCSRTPGANPQRHEDLIHFLIYHRRRRFWSPWLQLELAHRGDQTHLFGRFSPHPAVWTAYIFGYLLLATTALFALMFGAGQALSVGRPTAFWALAVIVPAAAAMWWTSQIGQRLARNEMADLRARVTAAVSPAEPLPLLLRGSSSSLAR